MESGSKLKVSRFLESFKAALENGQDVKMSNPLVGPALKAFALLQNQALWWNEEEEREEFSIKDSIGTDQLKNWIAELSEKIAQERAIEGEETRKAIQEIHKNLSLSLKKLEAKIPALHQEWKKQMEDRIAKLAEKMEQATPDSSRVYQEFVMLADKKDVSEELQRIDSHLKALNSLICDPKEQNVGKKLDFLAQELNREFTTLNNKTQDPETSSEISEAKLEVEKIREQSLNLV